MTGSREARGALASAMPTREFVNLVSSDEEGGVGQEEEAGPSSVQGAGVGVKGRGAKRSLQPEAEAEEDEEPEEVDSDSETDVPLAHVSVDEYRDENLVLYGYLHVPIVGTQYYRGVVHQGEFVHLVREPTNQYDRNAIR